MAVQMALEIVAGLGQRGRRGASRGRDRNRRPAQGTDLEADLAIAGEMGQQLADPDQVAGADLVHHERVGGLQAVAVLARAGLQRFEPGTERKSVISGTSVSERVTLGG